MLLSTSNCKSPSPSPPPPQPPISSNRDHIVRCNGPIVCKCTDKTIYDGLIRTNRIWTTVNGMRKLPAFVPYNQLWKKCHPTRLFLFFCPGGGTSREKKSQTNPQQYHKLSNHRSLEPYWPVPRQPRTLGVPVGLGPAMVGGRGKPGSTPTGP